MEKVAAEARRRRRSAVRGRAQAARRAQPEKNIENREERIAAGPLRYQRVSAGQRYAPNCHRMAEVVGSIPIGSTFPFMAALTSAPSRDHNRGRMRRREMRTERICAEQQGLVPLAHAVCD